jgi:hypothetical protein
MSDPLQWNGFAEGINTTHPPAVKFANIATPEMAGSLIVKVLKLLLFAQPKRALGRRIAR